MYFPKLLFMTEISVEQDDSKQGVVLLNSKILGIVKQKYFAFFTWPDTASSSLGSLSESRGVLFTSVS